MWLLVFSHNAAARKLKKVKNANSRYSVLAKSAVLGNVTCNVFSVAIMEHCFIQLAIN